MHRAPCIARHLLAHRMLPSVSNCNRMRQWGTRLELSGFTATTGDRVANIHGILVKQFHTAWLGHSSLHLLLLSILHWAGARCDTGCLLCRHSTQDTALGRRSMGHWMPIMPTFNTKYCTGQALDATLNAYYADIQYKKIAMPEIQEHLYHSRLCYWTVNIIIIFVYCYAMILYIMCVCAPINTDVIVKWELNNTQIEFCLQCRILREIQYEWRCRWSSVLYALMGPFIYCNTHVCVYVCGYVLCAGRNRSVDLHNNCLWSDGLASRNKCYRLQLN